MDLDRLAEENTTTGDGKIEGADIPVNTAAVVSAYLYVIIISLGIPGNFLVILSVILSQRLQTISNIFIVNLAVADLISCCVLPLKVIVHLSNHYHASFELKCQIELTVVHSCVGASMYSLAAIAVNRFVCIASSRHVYESLYRTKFIVLKIAFIWILPTSLAVLLPFAFDVGKLGFDFSFKTCLPLTSYPTTELFNTILIYGLYPLPLFMIVFCYLGILVKVSLHNRWLDNSGVTRTPGHAEPTGNPESGRRMRKTTSLSRSIASAFSPIELQITKNLFIVFLAYAICLTPLAVCILFWCPVDQNYARTLVLINSVINPLLYGFKHPLFRQTFVAILRCRRVPEPSSFLTKLMRSWSDH